MLKTVTLLLGLFALSASPALSETYYVAPLGATLSGAPAGTNSLPFPSIQAAFKSGRVKGGDTLLLKDGAYGSVIIEANAAFTSPVTIMSQNGKAAQFDRIRLGQDTRNIIFKNLSVWPRDPSTSGAYLVRSYNTVTDITLDGLDIRSEENAADFMKWDAAKWGARKFHGIVLAGERNTIVRNTITAVYDGISGGPDSLIADNIVNGYDGDGIRAVSRGTVRGNKITNCVKTDANHDDGFQSFASNGGTITDLVLDSNVIIEWTGSANHPLRCTLQGIGLFGGPYVNLTVVNNVVSVSHSHGISIYGANGAMVLNNTIVNSRGLSGLVPYLAVRPLKDGTLSKDVLVANNLAMSISGAASAENGIVFRNNSIISLPSLVFENPAAFDYRPKVSSGYIDTADPTVAPPTDVTGQKRPSGLLPDRGAYEVKKDAASTGPGLLSPPPASTVTTAPPTTTGPVIKTHEDKKSGTITTIVTSPGGSKRIMLTQRKD